MRIYLSGHDRRYAVEQMLLTQFPDERPEYPEERAPAGSNQARVSLSFGKVYASSVTVIEKDGKKAAGSARVPIDRLGDRLERDRQLNRIVRTSFYRAATGITGKNPPWGSLAGIRPAKLATQFMEKGGSAEKAERFLRREYYVSPARAALCVSSAQAGLAVKRSLEPGDVAIYIGIPFCPTRCAYCSFISNSVEKSFKLVEPFLDALYAEIDALAEIINELNLRVISVYMGGGTPTTLTASQLAGLMEKLASAMDLSRVREYCVEAGRPDTITEEKLRCIKDHGAGRISINPQSMSDAVLKAIGRRHSAADIYRAFELAHKVGGFIINADLIAGLPEDSPEGFADTLSRVLELGPQNITVHTLSLKKGSRITLEGTPIPGSNEVGLMLDTAMDSLSGSGYAPYYLYRQKVISGGFENVGWARAGPDSRYNILIMEELCSILALGGGGSTKIVIPSTGRIERVFNPKYPLEYIGAADRLRDDKLKIAKIIKENI
ncbi:MAG: coproporphyrinogen dehydrogenase HemZ [Oscillospiraceae bacterium]|nr:coproporphyrinogen dehydrogenase HemZ [Oscillospiraceae bacterium]